MSAQPLRHGRFAQAPPLQGRLDRSLFDELEPGRRVPARRTPETARQPELSDHEGTRDHRQAAPPSVDPFLPLFAQAMRNSSSCRKADSGLKKTHSLSMRPKLTARYAL